MVDIEGWQATAKLIAGGVGGWIVSLSINPAKSLFDMFVKGAGALSLAGLCSWPSVEYFEVNPSHIGLVAGMWALFGLEIAKHMHSQIKKFDFLAMLAAMVRK
jgi:hypothetical protein